LATPRTYIRDVGFLVNTAAVIPPRRGLERGRHLRKHAMKTTEVKSIAHYLSPRAATLLEELRDECQNISKLLAQLELPGLHEEQADGLLGELSAAILHLHEHSRGQDELLDKDSHQSNEE